MTTERDFLRAIGDEPDDDSLRLVFADWLDDHDKPAWAALIRRQVGDCPADPDGFHTPWRWKPSPPEPIDEAAAAEMGYPVPLNEAVFRRGLVDHVSIPADVLVEKAAELVAWGPVPMVQPRCGPADLATLAGWQAPPGLTRLDLAGNGLTDEALEGLASSSLFAGLTELCLLQAVAPSGGGSNRLSAAAAGLLTGAGRVAPLRALDLSGVPLGDDGLLALGRSPRLRDLGWLRLGYCRITGRAFSAWGEAAPWPRLRQLGLPGNEWFDPAGVDALARSAALGPVRRLDLSFGGFPDESAILLGRSPHAGNLRDLDLSGNRITEGGFAAVLESAALSGLRRLRMPASESRSRQAAGAEVQAAALAFATFAERVELLDLRGHPIGDPGVLALVQSERYSRLKELTLGRCGLGLTGVRALLNWAVADGVKVDVAHGAFGPDGVGPVVRLACHHLPPGGTADVNLHGMGLGDRGLDRLLALPDLARCAGLDLMRNGLSGEAVGRLAACPAIAALGRLNLGSNPVGDAGAAALAASPHLGRLAVLELGECDLTDAGVLALARSRRLPALEELALPANRLTDVAAFALADDAPPTLRRVFLDGELFGPVAWAALERRFGDGLGEC